MTSSNYLCISRDFADLVANNGLTNEYNVLSVTELQPLKHVGLLFSGV